MRKIVLTILVLACAIGSYSQSALNGSSLRLNGGIRVFGISDTPSTDSSRASDDTLWTQRAAFMYFDGRLDNKEGKFPTGVSGQYLTYNKTWRSFNTDVRNAISITGSPGCSYNATTGVITYTAPTVPAQFNPIQGSGILMSGTYPNISFSATGGGGGVSTFNLRNGAVIPRLGDYNTDSVAEGTTNKYYTDVKVRTVGDARYVILSGHYVNPSWIDSLPYSKLTGAPTGSIPSGAAGGHLSNTYPNPKVRWDSGKANYDTVYARLNRSYANPSWITSLAGTKITGLAAVANTGAFTSLVSHPTTKAGYGITDVYSMTQVDSAIAVNVVGGGSGVTWSQISSKPTTIAGFGITDAYTKTQTDAAYEPIITSSSSLNYWAGDKTWKNFNTNAITALTAANAKYTGTDTFTATVVFQVAPRGITSTAKDSSTKLASTQYVDKAVAVGIATVNTGGGGSGGVSKVTQALSGTTGAMSWNYASGFNAAATMAANRTLTITNDEDGDYGTLTLTQSSLGGNLTVPSGDLLEDGIGTGTTITLTPHTVGTIHVVSYYKRQVSPGVFVRVWNKAYYHN